MSGLRSVAVADRRGSPRLPARVSIGLQAFGRVQMCLSRDFSTTGVFVETLNSIATGSAVELFFMPPGAAQSVRLSGVVARQSRDGVGIAFAPAQPEVRKALDKFLASLQPLETETAAPDDSALPEEFDPRAIEAAIRREKSAHETNREAARQVHAAAHKALESGRWTHAAIALLERAIELAPEVAAYHHDLGAALYRIGEVERAVVEFDKALSLEPEDAEDEL